MPLYFVSKARGTAQTGAKVAKRRSKTGKIERERQEKAGKNRFFAPDCARSNALRAPPPAGKETPAAGKEERSILLKACRVYKRQPGNKVRF